VELLYRSINAGLMDRARRNRCSAAALHNKAPCAWRWRATKKAGRKVSPSPGSRLNRDANWEEP